VRHKPIKLPKIKTPQIKTRPVRVTHVKAQPIKARPVAAKPVQVKQKAPKPPPKVKTSATAPTAIPVAKKETKKAALSSASVASPYGAKYLYDLLNSGKIENVRVWTGKLGPEIKLKFVDGTEHMINPERIKSKVVEPRNPNTGMKQVQYRGKYLGKNAKFKQVPGTAELNALKAGSALNGKGTLSAAEALKFVEKPRYLDSICSFSFFFFCSSFWTRTKDVLRTASARGKVGLKVGSLTALKWAGRVSTAMLLLEPTELGRDEDLLEQMGYGLGVYQVPNVEGEEEKLE
jgi:hypothetical protein